MSTKKQKKRSGINDFLNLLGPHRKVYLLAVIVLAATYTCERLFMGWVARTLTDAVAIADLATLKATAIAAFVFYPVYTLLIPIPYRSWQMAIYRATAGLRERIFAHLQRLPLSYHEMHHSGEALSVMSNDIAAVEDAYRLHFWNLLQGVVQGVAAITAMLLLDVRLALITIGSSLVLAVANVVFADPVRRAAKVAQERLGGVAERMSDLLAGFEVIRSFSLGRLVVGRFAQANNEARAAGIRRVRAEALVSGVNNLAMGFFFMPMVVGAYWMLTGRLTFGAVVGMVQLSDGIFRLLMAIGNSLGRFQSSLAAVDRIRAVLGTPQEPDRLGASEATPRARADHTEGVALKNVAFAYNGDARALDGLTLQVDRDRVVALVGPSGGGKSTVLKLLLGLYQASAGEIDVAGQPLTDYRLADLRRLFAFVPQDAYLYDGTVEENIRYGKLDATDDEVIAAARAANAHEFITELPSGYQTRVGERGSHLSGGQKQRIAIARALLKDAPFLLLDEATSALDAESERLVQEALGRLMEGRTTLVVAHRLATIQNADEIIVIDAGRVAERGNHDDLLARDGIYRRLHDTALKVAGAATATAVGTAD